MSIDSFHWGMNGFQEPEKWTMYSVNPLTPMSDQETISPYNTISTR